MKYSAIAIALLPAIAFAQTPSASDPTVDALYADYQAFQVAEGHVRASMQAVLNELSVIKAHAADLEAENKKLKDAAPKPGDPPAEK